MLKNKENTEINEHKQTDRQRYRRQADRFTRRANNAEENRNRWTDGQTETEELDEGRDGQEDTLGVQ